MGVAAFPAAMAALSMGGQVLGGITQARATEQATKAQVRAAQYDAGVAEVEGTERASAIRRQGETELSRARANFGRSGVALTGSPLDALVADAFAVERNAQNAQLEGGQKAALLRRRAYYTAQEGQTQSTAELLTGALGGIRSGIGLIPWRGAAELGT